MSVPTSGPGDVTRQAAAGAALVLGTCANDTAGTLGPGLRGPIGAGVDVTSNLALPLVARTLGTDFMRDSTSNTAAPAAASLNPAQPAGSGGGPALAVSFTAANVPPGPAAEPVPRRSVGVVSDRADLATTNRPEDVVFVPAAPRAQVSAQDPAATPARRECASSVLSGAPAPAVEEDRCAAAAAGDDTDTESCSIVRRINKKTDNEVNPADAVMLLLNMSKGHGTPSAGPPDAGENAPSFRMIKAGNSEAGRKRLAGRKTASQLASQVANPASIVSARVSAPITTHMNRFMDPKSKQPRSEIEWNELTKVGMPICQAPSLPGPPPRPLPLVTPRTEKSSEFLSIN